MTARHKKLFSLLSCSRIEYTLTSSLDKFRFEAFAKDIAQRSGEPFDAAGISFVAPTGNRKTAGYHVHFSCSKERRRLRATLEYVTGTEVPDTPETRPFAEELMEWIGQFFGGGQVTADVEGSFLFSPKRFEPVLPMPMRLSLARKQEVQVTAMSVLVSGRPQNVYSAFVALDEDGVAVDVFGERVVRFKGFDLRSDLLPLSSVARLFVRARTS
jgi:hypothetical protein